MKKAFLCQCFSMTMILFCTHAAHAIHIGPSLGTLGAGATISHRFTGSLFGIHGDIKGFGYKKNISTGGVDYNTRLKLFNIGGFVDAYPYLGSLRLSAGIVYNKNKVNLKATPNSNVTLNGRVYAPNNIGQLDGKLFFNRFSPYVGLGYELDLQATLVSIDAGVLIQGKPQANISATGVLNQNQQFLNDAKRDVEKAANRFFVRYYPAISIAVKF